MARKFTSATGLLLRPEAMREAHKIRRTMLRLGEKWDWGRCQRYGWRKVRGKWSAENDTDRNDLRIPRKQHARRNIARTDCLGIRDVA